MRWIYWLPLLLFMACGPEPLSVEEPDDLIPIQQMVDVIVDLNIIEAQIAEVQLLQKVIKDSVHEYYGQ
ncbi:MAG: hypothetical protein JKY54_13340, partial [Flavobacteriales bacterium]|nr:hypothetical protein [Flavobacteriales bacterium]